MRQSCLHMLAMMALAATVTPCRAANVAKGEVIAAKGGGAAVAACAACHGDHGEGQPAAANPRLAGLDAAYLQAQIAAFKAGTRDGAKMSPIAKAMDAGSMADVAAYYAGLPAPTAALPPAPTPQVAAGRDLALNGDWSAKIPPCASCHGTSGLGVGAAFPPIAGQSAAYIANELKAWKSGARHDDPLALMKTVAARLDDAQVAAVSAYYATLPGRPPAKEGMP